MILTCLAHSMFLIELSNGLRIVTDPTDASSEFSGAPVPCDAVLVSHHHFDHCAMESVSGAAQVIDTAGSHTLAPGVTVTSIAVWHDDAQGAKRGANLIHVLEAEGLRIAHLGDLGHPLTPAQAAMVGKVDLLLAPVGGFYTIDAATAKATAQQLKASVVLPMHYKTSVTAGWAIAGLDCFIALYQEKDIRTQPLLRVTQEDLMCHAPVVVLTPERVIG